MTGAGLILVSQTEMLEARQGLTVLALEADVSGLISCIWQLTRRAHVLLICSQITNCCQPNHL